MNKYFHKLTREEFEQLVATDITWAKCAEQYPQPVWCKYPDAVNGAMGCWKLMEFNVHAPIDCLGCDFFDMGEVLKHATS